ncbi:hypothetical protein FRC17_009053 [Serendipita sp. 399]|nr:hypothetical protein FRC17_009053 [Serendipita sp. 399]
MGGGNGAKAQQKRERNAKQSGSSAKSTLKLNEAQKSIFVTTRAPALEEHAANKHSKTLAECFPNFTA